MSREYGSLPSRNPEYITYATYICDNGHTTIVERTATLSYTGSLPQQDWCTEKRCTARAKLVGYNTVLK